MCILVFVLCLWYGQSKFVAFYCGFVEVLFLSCIVNFLFFDSHFPVIIKKNEVDRACNTNWGDKRCIQGFDGETRGKETTWKTWA